ncbi:hypothetical protein Tco_0710299 [Tanacetum coccineum]
MKATMAWRCRACDGLGERLLLCSVAISTSNAKSVCAIQWYVGGVFTEWDQEPKIIMVNVIPPDHVDDVPVVEPNQHDDVPEPVLVDEDEDSKEDEFREEDPQKKKMIWRDSDGQLPDLMKRDINSLFGWVASLSRRLCGRGMTNAHQMHCVEQGTAAMEKLVEKLGNTEDKVECKKLKKELEEARGIVFEERPNEITNVLIEDEKSPSSEPRGSPRDS